MFYLYVLFLSDFWCTSSAAGLQGVVTELSRLEERTALSNEEIIRYSKQLLLPELGVKDIPLASLEDRKEKIAEVKQQTNQESVFPVYVTCKLGNDSQKAVQILQMTSGTELLSVLVKDIQGGLMAWAPLRY